MPFDLDICLLDTWVWNSRSEARVRAGPIVMNSPQFEDPSEMVRVERNHEIQTLSACTTNQALTKCIRLGAFVRSLQHGQPERLQRLIEFLRIDGVAVMDNESVSFIATHAFSKLLKRPLGRLDVE